jgi:hypothetical protein
MMVKLLMSNIISMRLHYLINKLFKFIKNEKTNGLGSFRKDIWDVLSEFSDGFSDEVLQLVN